MPDDEPLPEWVEIEGRRYAIAPSRKFLKLIGDSKLPCRGRLRWDDDRLWDALSICDDSDIVELAAVQYAEWMYESYERKSGNKDAEKRASAWLELFARKAGLDQQEAK